MLFSDHYLLWRWRRRWRDSLLRFSKSELRPTLTRRAGELDAHKMSTETSLLVRFYPHYLCFSRESQSLWYFVFFNFYLFIVAIYSRRRLVLIAAYFWEMIHRYQLHTFPFTVEQKIKSEFSQLKLLHYQLFALTTESLCLSFFPGYSSWITLNGIWYWLQIPRA